MTQPARRRGGLGRGLASLIPTGPADGGPRMGEAAADVVIGGAVVNAGVRPAGVGPAHTGAADVGAVYREIDPAAIEPNPRQPRQAFDEEALAELVHSINEFGMMQPIVVREIGDGAGERRYQLVMGSAGGGLHSALGWLRSRLSSAKPKMIICSGMHYWRTSTERS